MPGSPEPRWTSRSPWTMARVLYWTRLYAWPSSKTSIGTASPQPYTVSNYPPLFQLIQLPFARIVGPAFWYGRLVSILSAVIAAGLIGLILHTLTGEWIASAIGGLTLLAFPYLVQGSVLNRVDALAFALSLGGLYATVRWPSHRPGPWIAGLLFMAAAFTNPRYALAAPFTAFVWLWHLEHRGQA